MNERQALHGSGSELTDINRAAARVAVRIAENFEGLGYERIASDASTAWPSGV